ncbi:hypothetical protein AbraCBS73388_000064 [Aspergillus brasiliensis]|uniref:amidase n=1 Tax=Aspergillus brasiliensis TaxID=319629 RepID=A0A9W6DGM1_9EURO|nr:hypothetical protein AbraCBS73388_000064 [Aspergillus brasiliensis]
MGSNVEMWEQVVAEKRSLRDRSLKPYLVSDLDQRGPRVDNVHDRSRLDDPAAQEITDIDSISTLLEQLRSGRYTAEQVTRAYIQRCSCDSSSIETVFDEALSQARALDNHLQKTGELRGPLHGIPVSVKDQFDLKGVDTTIGYVGRAFAPATEDAAIVQILKEMGAVVLPKTNLPQTLMWAETDNNLWGRTVNPRNPELIPGGSSGGEGALMALHGSILGLGTDIGGSIRIPGSMNGLYAFKPTSSRYPVNGVPGPGNGQEHVHFSSGPLARDMESLCYVSRLVADSKPWEFDPKCAPLRWNETVFQEMQTRPLVIGLILDDGVVKVHPPIERALRELASKLQDQGHEVVLWDTSDHQDCVKLMDEYYVADGLEDVLRDINASGEPMIPHVQGLADRAKGKALSVVRKEVDVQPSGYEPRSDLDAWNWRLYDADAMHGYPVNLQVIGKTLQDEKVLGAVTIIEKIGRGEK